VLNWVLPLIGVFLEVLILYRALSKRLAGRYPFFYAYVACVLLVDVSSDAVYALHGATYRDLYFATEFLSLIVGYGVILEVTRKSFEPYAGAERFCRYLVVAIFFAIFSYVGVMGLGATGWSPASSLRELERDLRAVQALVIAGVVSVALYYGLHLGRNLGGIILGYGLYTASTVVALALRSYSGSFWSTATMLVQRYTYLVCLVIWVVALWSYRPNPAPDVGLSLEVDYEALAARTRGMLGTMRSLLERSARP
jgi:hypothetical protein